MKFGVLVFPGSNCDHDTYNVIETVAHQPVTFLWHDSEDLGGVDAVLVPGGFAYGDYLRTGAIARFSPVMQAVKRFADGGGLVLGICNGFQILTESGLLPGALMRNAGLKYICKQVHLRVETSESPFTNQLQKGEVLPLCDPRRRNYLRSQPQRIPGQHRRCPECRAQCSRHDAPPRSLQ
jgi:phosphoribosylformylglycinamidine synthase